MLSQSLTVNIQFSAKIIKAQCCLFLLIYFRVVTEALCCICDLTFLLHVSLLWLFLGSNRKERTASQALPFSIRSKSCPKKCRLGPRHDEERYSVLGGYFSAFPQRMGFPCHGLVLLSLPCMSSPHPNTPKGRDFRSVYF